MVDNNNLLTLQKPQSQSPPPSPPPPHRPSNMPVLYYGLVVVATAAILLALYNLLIVRWCATQYHRTREPPNHRIRLNTRTNTNNSNNNNNSSMIVGLTSSFRFRKGSDDQEDGGMKSQVDYDDTECSVCLSVFEDGEQVRKLPRCNHSFHAMCIDMWLYSHFDCPLCRTPVVELPENDRRSREGNLEESRDGLLLLDS